MNELIITHCGKLGDFLYCLPVASWLHRTYDIHVHWVLPRMFQPFRYIENLLMMQPMTARVSLVDYPVNDYNCGGQPYRFRPSDYGVSGDYYNFGLRGYPNKFLPAFYAEEYGLDYDDDYVLTLGGRWQATYVPTNECLRTSETAMPGIAPQAQQLPTAVDLHELARRLYAAAEVHSWFCGIAVLCWMMNAPATVYRVPGHAPLDLYFPEHRGLAFREVTL